MHAALHTIDGITGLLAELYQPTMTFWGLGVREGRIIYTFHLGSFFPR